MTERDQNLEIVDRAHEQLQRRRCAGIFIAESICSGDDVGGQAARRSVAYWRGTGGGSNQGSIAIDIEMVGDFAARLLPTDLHAGCEQLSDDISRRRRRRAVRNGRDEIRYAA